MLIDPERDYPSCWAAVVSIAVEVGWVPQTRHEWVKKSKWKAASGRVSDQVAAHVKTLDARPASYDGRPRPCARRRRILRRRSSTARSSDDHVYR
jgi:transposase